MSSSQSSQVQADCLLAAAATEDSERKWEMLQRLVVGLQTRSTSIENNNESAAKVWKPPKLKQAGERAEESF